MPILFSPSGTLDYKTILLMGIRISFEIFYEGDSKLELYMLEDIFSMDLCVITKINSSAFQDA